MGSLIESRKVLLMVLWLIAGLTPAIALAQQANVEAAKTEGKVIVYGSVVPQAMDGCTSDWMNS